jgi:hypothetical protein
MSAGFDEFTVSESPTAASIGNFELPANSAAPYWAMYSSATGTYFTVNAGSSSLSTTVSEPEPVADGRAAGRRRAVILDDAGLFVRDRSWRPHQRVVLGRGAAQAVVAHAASRHRRARSCTRSELMAWFDTV